MLFIMTYAVAAHAGIPSEQEYVDVYCKARGIQPPDPHDWCFFVALGLFRMAAILAGVGARAKLGNASSAQAATVSVLVTCIPAGSHKLQPLIVLHMFDN